MYDIHIPKSKILLMKLQLILHQQESTIFLTIIIMN